MAAYRTYDENDERTLYLDFLDGFRQMVLEEANEYTIAFAKVALRHTDLEVFYTDRRILWFVRADERLHVCDEMVGQSEESTLHVQHEYGSGQEGHGFSHLSAPYAFHNVFFQWLLDGRDLSRLKYGSIDMGQVGGIGSILVLSKRLKRVFERFGLRFINRQDHIGRFRTQMLDKYFTFELSVDDATDENTLQLGRMFPLIKTQCVFDTRADIDASTLDDRFISDMDEYFDDLFEDRRMLGILIRGTDYISAGLSGIRKMATVSQMLPLILQWMAEDGYDRIFLATEDEDILEQMRAEFGGKVVVVSQGRHVISDFRPGEIISELERETFDAQEYDERVEDTTINHFYALYMLSRCDSFMCSGQRNGWDVVNGFNGGRFHRCYKFQVGVS